MLSLSSFTRSFAIIKLIWCDQMIMRWYIRFYLATRIHSDGWRWLCVRSDHEWFRFVNNAAATQSQLMAAGLHRPHPLCLCRFIDGEIDVCSSSGADRFDRKAETFSIEILPAPLDGVAQDTMESILRFQQWKRNELQKKEIVINLLRLATDQTFAALVMSR